MVELIPAILEKDFDSVRAQLARVRGLAPWVQLDVCDGIFVPSKTWPFGDAHFKDLISGEEGLPFWQDFNFEIDLMVQSPLQVLEEWIAVGAARIIMQVGGRDSISDVRKALNGRAEFVIAVSLDDDLSQIDPYIEEGDAIQIMGIASVGLQRQPFDERSLELLRHFRERFPGVILSVDGGVNLDTAQRLVEAGATRLAIGSALFGAPDTRERLHTFNTLLHGIHH